MFHSLFQWEPCDWFQIVLGDDGGDAVTLQVRLWEDQCLYSLGKCLLAVLATLLLIWRMPSSWKLSVSLSSVVVMTVNSSHF